MSVDRTEAAVKLASLRYPGEPVGLWSILRAFFILGGFLQMLVGLGLGSGGMFLVSLLILVLLLPYTNLKWKEMTGIVISRRLKIFVLAVLFFAQGQMMAKVMESVDNNSLIGQEPGTFATDAGAQEPMPASQQQEVPAEAPAETPAVPEAGILELEVPSELPPAFIGQPYSYSFAQNLKGSKEPDSWEVHVYDYLYSYEWRAGSDGTLSGTPSRPNEGEYLVEVCAYESYSREEGVHCANTTLYVMSDAVTVKGAAKLSSSILWRPRATVTAYSSSQEDTKRIKPDVPAAVRFNDVDLYWPKDLPSVSAESQIPPAAQYGGSSASLQMYANSTAVSAHARGEASCGQYDGGISKEFNAVWFQILGAGASGGTPGTVTDLYLNINNTGTKPQIVDLGMSGWSDVVSDATTEEGRASYGDAMTSVLGTLSEADYDKEGSRIEVLSSTFDRLPPGGRAANATTVRLAVRPGNHIFWVGVIELQIRDRASLLSPCPGRAGTDGGLEVTVVPAPNDGKRPVGSLYALEAGSLILDQGRY